MPQFHSEKSPRHYFLPLSTGCLPGCGLCDAAGCRNERDRTKADIRRLIGRAVSGSFTAVEFSSSLLEREDLPSIAAEVGEAGLKALVQMHSLALTGEYKQKIFSLSGKLGLNLVFTGSEALDPEFLDELTMNSVPWHLTVMPVQGAPVVEFLARIPRKHWGLVHFSIPPFEEGKGFLTVREALRLISDIRKVFPELPVRPPLGREVWDSRIDPGLSLDSDAMPAFSYSIASSQALKFSVVIPSFNSGELLKNVIRHLLWQDLPRDEFEIIVVDDGSTDGSMEIVRNFVAPEAGRINFKYLYFSRHIPRRPGDGNFRAGISRNLGVKHATGEVLAFLDSDIIVPRNYLSDLWERHRNADVIQAIRLHLKKRGKESWIRYDSVDKDKDTYILEKGYWGAFFAVKDWQALPFFWKYTCTYALSLKADHFKEAGWFRRTFVYYGFEDTDLGYRLAKAGRSFALNPTLTFHLDAKTDRSEYQRSAYLRHLLLSKTAKVFFLNTLDPEVYQHLIMLMGSERSAYHVVKDLLFPKKRVGLGSKAHLMQSRPV